ncbi:Hypothetical predicted protein [Cloeon dipterum]|uniref:C-type lectin domain-containing protein n=1 Tax=Cloeon dipterum TaxID=197152 RepID=A0A8S1DFP4_9INSE|nr:Hypothetical predicted protein [Cloeon dipterum]
MQPTQFFTVTSIGISLFIMWNVGYSTESRVSLVGIGQRHVVVKLSKGSNKNSHKRAMIVKCCGSTKCSKNQPRNKKNGTASLRVAKIVRNELNGPSHRLVAIGKKRYKFPPEKATFEEAKNICEEQGLEITSVSDSQESQSIDNYLSYIGLGSESLFTSLPAEGADLNWGAGKPPGGPGECLTQFKGAFYNASCNQLSQFSCQEKPAPTGETTEGYNLFTSIGDAVLNFVGGKNIIAPSDRASVPQATSMCKDQGMQLMGLDSLTQLGSVQAFLGGIGMSSSTLLTSLKKTTSDSSSNWLGDLASALLPPPANPADAGDCMGISSLGLLGVSCDMVSNFVCEAPPPKLISDTGEELPFSKDLLSMATALGVGTFLEPESSTTLRKPSVIVSKTPTRKSSAITRSSTFANIYVSVVSTPAMLPPPGATLHIQVPVSTTAVSTVALLGAAQESSNGAYSGKETTNSSTASTMITSTVTTAPILPFNASGFGRDIFSPNITLPYASAIEYCNSYSLDLVSLDCFEKFQMIYNLTGLNSGRENHSFYTGLTWNHAWSASFFGDKYARDAVNKASNGSCIVLSNNSYRWTTCTESLYFVCESQKSNINMGSVLNYSIFRNYATQLFIQYTNYEARSYCLDHKFALAAIDRFSELYGELKYLIYITGMEDVPFHVSVNKINGSFPKERYLEWAPGNPDNSKDCVAYLNYSLVSIDCTTVAYPICEIVPSSTSEYPLSVMLSGKRYQINYLAISPVDGGIFCNFFGLEMVSIEWNAEFKALRDSIKNLRVTNFAIDLNRGANTSFEWGNGADFDPTVIGWTNMSAINGSGDCGAFYQSSIILVDCFYPTPLICEEPKDFGNFITLTDPNNTDHTYKFFNLTSNFSAARTYCQSYGSDLIVLDSFKELETIVVPFLTNNTFAKMDFYVSAELIGSNAASWVNSANLGWLTYADFNAQFYPTGTCLISSKSGTAFYASDCTTPRYFLCEDNFTLEVTTVAARPFKYDAAYYKITSIGASTYYLFTKKGFTYQEARIKCQQAISSDLVIIESQMESDNLNTWLMSTGMNIQKIFIGLNQIDRQTISHWINNASLNFNAFAIGEKRDKICVILTLSHWTTTNCDDSEALFMCETNNSTIPKTTGLYGLAN